MGSAQLPLVATSFRHKQTVYTLEQKIGEGGYGAVFRATRKILMYVHHLMKRIKNFVKKESWGSCG